MFMDPIWLLVTVVSVAIAGGASLLVRTTFARYARRRAASGLTGAEAAQILLERNGIHDVSIQMGSGFLSDLYHPLKKMIVLSPDVYRSSSLSAIGVACHEAGHAVQHHVGFFPVHRATSPGS
jgi:Zn-dependent membrane protease YugP